MRLDEDAKERIRRSYYLDGKSMRRIAQEEGYSRPTIEKAIANQSSNPYHGIRVRNLLLSLAPTRAGLKLFFTKMSPYRANNATPSTVSLR